MKKAYVVLKKGFEYDDNIYCEIEGGNPSLIAFDKKGAEQKVYELNIKEYKQVNINNFSYQLDDLLNVDVEVYENFNKSLIEKYGEINKIAIWDRTDNRLHPMANDEESKNYSEMVNLDFYEVVETDIDMESYRETKINSILEK
jgi:hypothetical protein